MRAASEVPVCGFLDIEFPANFSVEDLPAPVTIDDGFATYTSKTEVIGHSLRYSRAFEIKQLSVPVAKTEELKQFYRLVYHDERVSAVLKQTGH